MKYFDLKGMVTNSKEHKENSSHYICTCPYCGKPKLYIKKDFSVGFCFVCSEPFFPNQSNNFSSTDIDYRSQVSFKEVIDEVKPVERITSGNELLSIYRKGKKTVQLLDWLLNRNQYFPIDNTKIREHNGFALIPYFYKNDLIYLQKRNISNAIDKRYINPPKLKKPVYICGDEGSDTLVLCEGPFDAMAINLMMPNVLVMGVLGLYLTEYQFEFILRFKDRLSNILIWMDDPFDSLQLRSILINKYSVNEMRVHNFHHWYLGTPKVKEDPENYLQNVGLEEAQKILQKDYERKVSELIF